MEEEGIYLLLQALRRPSPDGGDRHAAEHPGRAAAGERDLRDDERRRSAPTIASTLGEDAGAALRQESPLGPLLSSCPTNHLEARKRPSASVPVGKVTHKLKPSATTNLEIYDYPGRYAQRFDGIDPGGGDRPATSSTSSTDRTRTVGIRMEQEEAAGHAGSKDRATCGQFTAGHKFTLERHFDANGALRADARRARGRQRESYTQRQRGLAARHTRTASRASPPCCRYRPRRIDPGAGDRGHADGRRWSVPRARRSSPTSTAG